MIPDHTMMNQPPGSHRQRSTGYLFGKLWYCFPIPMYVLLNTPTRINSCNLVLIKADLTPNWEEEIIFNNQVILFP